MLQETCPAGGAIVLPMETPCEPTVRSATPEDVEGITRLSEQLGYPSTGAETAQRLAEISRRDEHAVLVAADGEILLGWIHVAVSHTLLADTPAEIMGLVIDERYRGRGIGRVLMRHAEQWARDLGCRSVRLRSNVVRTRAHAFYERLGYRVTKSQKAFCKELMG